MDRDTFEMLGHLEQAGIERQDAYALRRIAMTLHRWNELECGVDNGCIERDEESGKAYWLNSHTMKRYPIADREKGAVKRLNKILAKYPGKTAYLQGDPRGASLFILQPGDIPEGCEADCYYSRGIAVYK